MDGDGVEVHKYAKKWNISESQRRICLLWTVLAAQPYNKMGFINYAVFRISFPMRAWETYRSGKKERIITWNTVEPSVPPTSPQLTVFKNTKSFKSYHYIWNFL